MNCSKLALTAALVLGFVVTTVHASPVVIGEPTKGTHVTTLQDGKAKVEVTTTGITIDDGDENTATVAKLGDKGSDQANSEISADEDGNVKIARGGINIHTKNNSEKLEDIVVPVAFFLFLLAAILGGKYISSRNEQRRLELLKMMVEKGQTVPEGLVSQILVPQGGTFGTAPEAGDARQTYKRYRNAYGFTIAGTALMFYAILSHSYEGGAMISGLVFLCLGAGGLAGLYLPKQRGTSGTEKIG